MNPDDVENGTRAVADLTGDEDELAAALDAYLAAFEAGEAVDPDEYVEQHPAIADRLRACLRGLHLIEAAAESMAVTPSAPAPITGPDPLRIGDFAIIREIGRGGMGVVYEAIEHPLGRRVALKVLPLAAAVDPRQIARFRVEAQAASMLSHPHIVPVYSVGCQGGVHYYAMQLIDGPTLAHRIARARRQGKGDPLDSTKTASPAPTTTGRAFCRETAELARQAAEALEHAHQQGVLHRDVKPSNLMVDARGHLWVTDFGLARFQQADSSLTAPGDVLGTLRYMSPEQASADHAAVDRRADVYSMGATLYEMATLHPVFEGSDRAELIRRILHEEPRRPRAWRPDLPRDLETIVLKAMAKEPSGRYASAQAMADDLIRFLDDRPILARRPGPMERTARWARRHAAALAVAVPMLAAAAVAMAIAFGVVLAQQAETRRAYAFSRQTVDRMYTRVAQEWLGKRPALQPVQREFLEEALAYYQRFAAEAGADDSIRAEAGIAALRVGEIQRTLGRSDEAGRAYRQAIAALEPIPAAPGVLEAIGQSHGGLGQLLIESERQEEARPELARAVELTRRFADSGGIDAPHRAAAWHRLGMLLKLSGRDDEAEAAYRRTIELARSIGGPIGRKMQAGVHGNLGDLLSATGRDVDAERALAEAARLYESILRDEPDVPLYRQELAAALDRLGAMAAGRPGDRPEAERLIRRALANRDRLAADSPDVPAYREGLALTLLDLAGILSADGRPADAEPIAARSVALLEDLAGRDRPGSASARRRLIGALDRHGAILMSVSVARPADAERAIRRALDLRRSSIAEGTVEPAEAATTADAFGRLAALLAARGEAAEARRHLARAADSEPSPATRAHYLMRSVQLADRDVSLSPAGRIVAMRADASRAIEALRAAVDSGSDPVAPYLLAWYLTAGPVEELRDPPGAIAIARGLLGRSPGSWVAWATLGAASYRDNDADGAVEALDRAAALNRGELLHYGYFLAMALHRLGEPARARDAFDRADHRSGGPTPDNEVIRLRAEAAAMLGLDAVGPGEMPAPLPRP